MRVQYPPSTEVALRSLATKSGLPFREIVRMAERNQLHLAAERVHSRTGYTSVRRGRRGMNARVALRLARALKETPLSP
ncbi:hypothetical protein [Mycobacterium syngnathidarum]